MEPGYEYIEAYFTKTLDDNERRNFEARCVDDKAFAGEVAFYIASRQALRQALLEQKQQQWATADDENKTIPFVKPPGKTFMRRWLPYVAAACVILAVALLFLARPSSPQQLATAYVQKTYSQLSLDMGPGDTLQKAIVAYNNKDYRQAAKMFEILQAGNPGNSDEKKYAGLGYLFTGDYDKALQQFDELAKMPGLHNNPGNFLKAITLMERNGDSDKQQAKQLLEQVVRENTEGREQAIEWLKKL